MYLISSAPSPVAANATPALVSVLAVRTTLRVYEYNRVPLGGSDCDVSRQKGGTARIGCRSHTRKSLPLCVCFVLIVVSHMFACVWRVVCRVCVCVCVCLLRRSDTWRRRRASRVSTCSGSRSIAPRQASAPSRRRPSPLRRRVPHRTTVRVWRGGGWVVFVVSVVVVELLEYSLRVFL
jgi:hypothetical protein